VSVRSAQTVDPDAARREAQHILSDGRFRSGTTPRPLRSPLHWLGDRIDGVFSAIGRLLGSVSGVLWLTAAVIVIAVVVWALVRARRRHAPRLPTVAPARGVPEDDEDPDALERAADDAERDGDLARAVRLRFRAGLLRLGGRGAIRYRPSVTTGEVRRTLASPRFDDLAGTFEAVTYGGKAADPPDVDAARREWPNVLEESARR
jgi:hypothetical protein